MQRSVLVLVTIAFGIASSASSVAQPAKPDSQLETVIVTAPRLSDEVKTTIHNFVTSFSMPAPVSGEVARWDSHNPICPMTYGFTRPEDNNFVTLRVRQIAADVGAPVKPAPCKPNIEIYFAASPQELLDGIREHGGSVLLTSRPSRAKQFTAFTHPIQAWYATETRDICGMVRLDNEDSLWWDGTISDSTCQPRNSPNYATEGSLLRTGLRSELAHIYIVADVSQTAHYSFLAVADDIAMMALSQTQDFAPCQGLPSVANLMSASCDASRKAGAITNTDLAYLTGVYKMDPGASLQTQQSSIAYQIEAAMGGQ
jgi:hypothetical protein